MSTFIARTAVADSPKRSRLAIAIVSALALVMALLTPAMPANAAGSGSITSVSPTSGPVGTIVTISGDVAGVTSVLFGTVAGGSLTVAGNGQSLTVTAPTQTTGTNPYSIKIVKTDGSVTLNSAYTYRAVTPVVSSVSPANGSATGYNTVTISGSNFTGTTNVKFGTVAAVSFSVLSDSRITAVVPAGTAGAAVPVTVEGRGTSVNAVNYTYKSSTCVAGTYLTTKFGFNSSALTKAQKRKIRETADEFVTLGCEEVNLVKYIGKRKGASATYKAYLTLQNKRANAVLTVLEKRLTTWSVPIVVTEVKRASQKSQAKKTSIDSLVSYRNVLLRIPAFAGIESLYPNVGSTTGTTALGTTVVITGKGFTNLAPTGAVRFGSAASPSYTVNATGTMITATVPSGLAGVTNITVQTGVAGTSTAKLYSRQFIYQAAPTVTSLNVTSGSIVGGTSVNITGTGFSGVTSVRFGTTRAISFTVNSSTSITAVSPAGAYTGSAVTVIVETLAGDSNPGGSFTYRTAPSISDLAWSSAGTAPGTLEINGSQFLGATDVKLGTTSIFTGSAVAATKITKTGIAQPGSGVEAKVTTPFGEATFGNVVASITGATWTAAAGGTLVLTGTGFTGATSVAVSGVAGTPFALIAGNITGSGTQTITKTGVPAPANGATIVVTTPSGPSNQFTFVAPVIATATWTAADGGTLVLTGTGFTGATSVAVSGVAGTPFALIAGNITGSGTQTITKTGVPAPANGATIVVTTATAASNTFSFVAPVIATATWTAADGGTLVLTGTGFTGATSVAVSGVAGTPFALIAGNITGSGTQTITKTGVPEPANGATIVVTTATAASNTFSFVAV